MARNPRLSPAEQEIQDHLKQVSAGQAGINPQAQTLARSTSSPRAQRAGQQMVDAQLDQNAANREDAARETERQARESARLQEAAQREQEAAAKAEQARNVRAAAAEGVATTTDVDTGRRTIKTHDDGSPVFKPGPVGPVAPIGTVGARLEAPGAAPRDLPNSNVMLGWDGAAATTGEPERATIFAQPIRDDRGNVRQVVPEPKTDKASGFQYVEGTDKSTGLPTKTTVGVDENQRRSIKLGQQLQQLDLQDNAHRQAKAAFDPAFKPVKDAYELASREWESLSKAGYERRAQGWVKVSAETGKETLVTPEIGNAWEQRAKEAKGRLDRAKQAYDKEAPRADTLAKAGRDIASAKLRLMGEKIRLDAGLPAEDGGISLTLAEAEAGPSPASQAASAAADEVIPPEAPKPVTADDALAKAFGGVPGIENVTLEGTDVGYSWMKRDGATIGRVDNRGGSPVIVLNPEANDLQAHIAAKGEASIPVYLADNPNRPSEQENAGWAAGALQVISQPVQGPLADGQIKAPEIDQDAALKAMGASYNDITRRVKDGTLSVRMGEALMQGIYGDTLKAEDPAAPETFQKFLEAQPPAFQREWAAANKHRDPAKLDELRGQFISEWYSANQHKPGVTFAQQKALRGNREARGVGEIAESMAKGAGGVAVDALGSMGGMIGGTAALVGLTMASPFSDTSNELRKAQADVLGRGFTNFNRGLESNFKKHLTSEGKARLGPLAVSSYDLKSLIENRQSMDPEEFKGKMLAAAAQVGKAALAVHELNQEDGWAVEAADFDIMQDRALGSALLSYAETGDPAMWETFQRRLLLDKGSRQAEDLAGEVSAGKNRLAAAFAGGVNAPPQEMLIELLSSAVTFGAGKAIGATGKAALKTGTEGARLARLRRAMAGISDDFAKFGKFTDTLANPASNAKRIANKAVGVVKTQAVEASGEAVEEAVAGMADPTATAESVAKQAGAGFVGGFILGPLIAAPGAISQRFAERAAKQQEAKKFSDWYNQTNADTEGFTPLAPAEADAALAMLDPETHGALVQDHQQAMADLAEAATDAGNSLTPPTPARARPSDSGTVAATNKAWQENAASRMSRALARAAETRAAVTNYVGGVVEASQSTKGMEAPARTKMLGLTKAATGRTDLLTGSERQAIAGLETKEGIPYFADVAGKTVFTAEGRAEVLADNPLVGGLIQTDESRALIEQAAAAQFTPPTQTNEPNQQGASGPQAAQENLSPAPQTGQAAGAPVTGGRGAGDQGAAPQRQAADVAQEAPAGRSQAVNPAELDAAEYEAYRQQNPEAPDIPTVVAQAKAAGRPVSPSMQAAAGINSAPENSQNIPAAAVARAEDTFPGLKGRFVVDATGERIGTGGAYMVGGKVVINLADTREDLAGYDGSEAQAARLDAVLDEEITHLAQLEAAMRSGVAMDAFYADLWNDFTPAQQKAAAGTYQGNFEALLPWQQAAETVRMLVQQRKAGTVTELTKAFSKNMPARLLQLLRDSVAILQEMLAGGTVPPRVAATIEAIEAILAEFEGKTADSKDKADVQSAVVENQQSDTGKADETVASMSNKENASSNPDAFRITQNPDGSASITRGGESLWKGPADRAEAEVESLKAAEFSPLRVTGLAIQAAIVKFPRLKGQMRADLEAAADDVADQLDALPPEERPAAAERAIADRVDRLADAEAQRTGKTRFEIVESFRAVAGKQAAKAAAGIEQAVVGSEKPEIPAGKVTTRDTPGSEMTIEVTQTALDVDQLVGSSSPLFPGSALQPRNRATQASRNQREEMVNNLRDKPDQWKRYVEGVTTDAGRMVVAPLFAADGSHMRNEAGKPLFYVISGNGRRNAIEEAQSRKVAGSYLTGIREFLAGEGVDTAGVSLPVPVSIYVPSSPKDAIDLAEYSNRDAQLSVSNTEQASRDSKSIEEKNLLKLWEPDATGDPGAASNRDFVKGFARAVGDEGILDTRGELTDEGAKRIERAMVAALVGPDQGALLDTLFNRGESLGLRGVLGGIASETGSLLKLAIAKPDFDLQPALVAALKTGVEAKQAVADGTFRSVSDFFDQGSLFESTDNTPERQLARALVESRSRKAVREILSSYRIAADAVDTGTMSMFAEAETSREDLILKALEARPIDQVIAEVSAEFGLGSDLSAKLRLAAPAIKKLEPGMRREFTAAIGAEVDRLRAGVLSAEEWQRLNPDILTPKEALLQRFLDSHDENSIQGGFNRLLSKPVQAALASSPTARRGGFYSQLQRVIEAKMPASASVDQVVAIATGGAKAEEVKWSGIVQAAQRLAAENGGKVPKAALMEHLRNEGSVRLEEVASRGPTKPVLQPGIRVGQVDGEWYIITPVEDEGPFDSREEALAAMNDPNSGYWSTDVDFVDTPAGSPRFEKYTLPGGENYREVVLAMPPEKTWLDGSKVTAEEMADPDTRAAIDRLPGDGSSYTSSHFPDVPNYVAHMRTNERVDADGKPGLFIEEIQSDRHQAGREKGYDTDAKDGLPAGFALKNSGDNWWVEDSTGKMVNPFRRPSREEAIGEAINGRSTAETMARNVATGSSGIPDAPFRKDWPLQMFKRALADAVAGGKEWIGWTVGETQNDRFDLSKQVAKLEYLRNEDGSFTVEADLLEGGQAPIGQNIPEDKLADYVGKEVAAKMIEGRGYNPSWRDEPGWKGLKDVDLKVGGSGMKGFYDQILPKEIGKYVKQWGGKVEAGVIPSKRLVSGEEAARLADQGEWNTNKETLSPIHRIDITPAMKAGVESGQALFSSATVDPRITEAFGNFEPDAYGLPPIPRTLPDGHPLLQQTKEKKTAEMTADHPLVVAGLLPVGQVSRKEFGRAVVKHFVNQATPLPAGQRQTVFATGGGGGAGKSSIMKILIARGDLDTSNAVLVNADDIKEIIPEFEEMRRAGDGRGAATVHEESSQIAKNLLDFLFNENATERYDVIYDATLGNRGGAVRHFERWKAAGAFIHFIGVTIDPKEAMIRAVLRGKSSGRWVPSEMLAEAHAGFNAAAREYMDLADAVNFYDNTPPTPTELAKKRAGGRTIDVVSPEYFESIKLRERQFEKQGDRPDPTRGDGSSNRGQQGGGGPSLREPESQSQGDRGQGAGGLPGQERLSSSPTGFDLFGEVEQQITGPRAKAKRNAVAAAKAAPSGSTARTNIAKQVAAREGVPDLDLFAAAAQKSLDAKPKRGNAGSYEDDLFTFKPRASTGGAVTGATGEPGAERGNLPVDATDLFGQPRGGQSGGQRAGGGSGEFPRGLGSEGDGVAGDAIGGESGLAPASVQGGDSGTSGRTGGSPADRLISQAVPEPELVPVPDNENDRNTRIDPTKAIAPKGAKAKTEANFKAIELLRQLDEEQRNPTQAERAVLLAYTGWGSLKGAFDDAMAERWRKLQAGSIAKEWAAGNKDEARRYADASKADTDYVGILSWGDKWGETHKQLKDRFSEKEYNAAKRSVLNAHFTTPSIIDGMWGMLRKLGFRGGNVLEPAGGTGHFIGTQPEDLAARTKWSAVELDQITARILSRLYPQARINSMSPDPSREVSGQGFEEARIPNNSLDLAISNVPFFEKGPWQAKKQFGRDLNLHNYFFARALEKVKPGGLVVFITSSSTMENNQKQRELLASMGELVAAVRLPNTAFKENAGTEVTTDIIILRKPDGSNFQGKPWLGTRTVGRDVVQFTRNEDQTVGQFLRAADPETTWADPGLEAARVAWKAAEDAANEAPLKDRKPLVEVVAAKWKDYQAAFQAVEEQNSKIGAEVPIRVNEYFAANPSHAFGKHSLQGSMYRANEYTLSDDGGASIEERFKAITDELPADVMGKASTAGIAMIRPAEKGDQMFSFIERDGQVWQVEKDALQPVEWKDQEIAVFRSWKKVAQATRNLIAGELRDGASDASLRDLRAALNRAYDYHVKAWGPVTKTGRGAKHDHLLEDPDFPLTSALEEERKEVTAKGKTITHYDKADIFRERMNKPLMPPEKAESISDALVASMVWMGYPNDAYMGQLLGRPAAEVVAEALDGGLIFTDPQAGDLVLRDAYLSGHVQGKLDVAREAAKDDPRFESNVRALEAALPPRRTIGQIGINLGAPWVPNEVIAQWMGDSLGLNGARVEYVPASNHWSVFATGNSEEFSTGKVSTIEMVHHALSLTAPKVTKEEGSGKDRKTVADPDGTALAQAKLADLKRDFAKWCKTTEAEIEGKPVVDIVTDSFNERSNGHVPPSYSGDHITLPGCSEIVYRNGIRRSAIARMLDQKGGMIAHGVGFGKTFTLIALAMELKRLGKANRPMITVENSTLYQFAASFRAAYPNAKLLVADEKSFSGPNRRRFVSRIATGDFDAIVMAHSQFNLISNHPDVVNAYIQSQIDELEAVRAVTDEDNKQAVRALEAAKISLENRRKSMLADLNERQDVGLYWEDLGVDALLVDEAHRYKNAPVITRMSDIKNIPTGQSSQRAIGMTLKVNSVQGRTGGRNVYFATGTPVTNTMAEAYIMMRFTNPDLLEQQGIYNFDNFAAQYGDIVTNIESTWKGSLSSVTRFAKFVNGPSLVNLIRSSWDVQMDPDVAGLKRPTVAGGGSELIILPPPTPNKWFNRWVIDSVASQWDDPNYWAQFEKGKRGAFEKNPWMQAIPIMTMQAGIAAALDIRLVDPRAEDHPESKVNVAVRRTLENYAKSADRKGTQAIFADLRGPFNMSYLAEFAGDPELSESDGAEVPRFDLYKDIVDKLVAGGIPRSEVGIVGSEMSKEKRSALFEKVNSGEIRVVIGSSETMGVGVNMQERLFAIHHLMPPRDFKPAMMEQRNGRILRQGNQHYDLELEAFVSSAEKSMGRSFRKEKSGRKVPDLAAAREALAADPAALAKAETAAAEFHIQIIEYGLEKSLDSAIYQMMTAKQRFITQILSGQADDSFEDPTDEISMSMAEMSARTMGDPDLIRMVELERDLKKLRMEANGFIDEVSSARQSVAKNRREIARLSKNMPGYEKLARDLAKVGNTGKEFPVWEFNGKTIDRNKPEDAEKGWKAPKLLEPLDLFLLEKSKDLRRTDKNRSVHTITVDGGSFAVEIYQAFNDDSVRGSVQAASEFSPRYEFSGAQSLIRALNAVAAEGRMRPEQAGSEIARLEAAIPALERKASRVFEKQGDLDALEQEAREVKARLAGGGSAKVAEALAREAETPANYPGRGLAAPEQALFSSPTDNASAVDEALAKMPPIYRQVFEAVSKGAAESTVAKRFNVTPKAVTNILNAVRSRITAATTAVGPAGLAPAMRDGKFDGGRPDLALSTIPEVAAIDQIRNDSDVPGVREWDEVKATAEKRLKADYAGEYDRMLEAARNQRQLSDVEVAIAKAIITRETMEGRINSPADRVKLAMLIHGYRDIGTETARALAIRRDPNKTPAERHAMFIAEALFTPDEETRKELRAAKKGQQENILAGWTARIDAIKAELLAQGIDIEATLAAFNAREQAKRATEEASPRAKAAIDETVRKLGRREKAVIEAIRSGALISKAAFLTGMTADEVKAIYARFLTDIKEAMANSAKRFLESSLAASPLDGMMDSILAGFGLPQLDDIDDTAANFEQRKKEKAKAEKKARQKPKEKPAAEPRKESPAFVTTREQEARWKALADKWRAAPLSTWRTLWQDEMNNLGPIFGVSFERARDEFIAPWRALWQTEMDLRPQDRMSFEQWMDQPATREKRKKQPELFAEPINETTGPNEKQTAVGQGSLGLEPINETTGTFDLNDPVAVKAVLDAFAVSRPGGKWMDPVMEFWRMSILTGPQTHIVNIGSNLLNTAWDLLPRRGVEATINAVLGLVGQGSDKSATLAEFVPMAKQLRSGIQLAARNGLRSWQLNGRTFEAYARAEALQLDFTGVGNEYVPPALGGKIGAIMRALSFRAMTAADEMMKSFYAQIEVAAQSHRIAAVEEKLKGPAYEARLAELMIPGSVAWLRAIDGAKRITFQDDLDGNNPQMIRRLDQLAGLVKQGRELPWLGRPLTLLIPFVDTPLNIFKQAVEMSPLGAFLAVTDGIRSLRRRIFNGKLTKEQATAEAEAIYDRLRLIRDLTNQTIAWGAFFALQGLVGGDDDELPVITGTVPYKVTARGERDNAYAVMPPMTIRVGDVQFSYARVEPFATMLASTTDLLVGMKRNGGLNSKVAGETLARFKDQVSEKTFLQGVSSVLNAIEDPDRFAERLASNIVTGFVPNLIRQPLRESDAELRNQNPQAGDGFLTSLAKRVGYSLVPGKAPVKIDVWGNTIEQNRGELIGGNRATDMAFRILDPTNLQVTPEADPIDRWIFRWNLGAADPSDRVAIVPIKDSLQIRFPGEKDSVVVPLTPAEHLEVNRRAGQTARAMLGDEWDDEPLTLQAAERIKDAVKQAQTAERASLKMRKLAEGKPKE